MTSKPDEHERKWISRRLADEGKERTPDEVGEIYDSAISKLQQSLKAALGRDFSEEEILAILRRESERQ